MKKKILVYGAALIVAASTAVTATAVWADESDDGPLADALDTILKDDRLTDSQASLVVADADSGDVVYNHNGNARSLPASNTKLLTSTAAMGILGGDYTFSTDVASSAKTSGDTLGGDVFLRGTGDPTMLAKDYDALAKDMAKDGITKVDGDLVADDTAYDSERLGSEWGWDDLPYYYAAEVSALTVAPDTDYDAGNVIVNVKPGKAEGDKTTSAVEPTTDAVKIDNQATTGPADSESTMEMDRDLASDTITVTGQVPAGGKAEQEWMSVSNPTGYAADVFSKALADNGIKVSGDVRLGESTPKGAKSLASHKSMTLSKLLTPFLKKSNNGHAETLTKAIGRKVSDAGTWDAGLKGIASYSKKLGTNPDKFSQGDGSGMSRRNEIAPAQFTKLMLGAKDQKWFDTWYKALPIACASDEDAGGTLASRMCDTKAAGNIHAKTGSLSGASGLSGYVTDADGRDLVFSMISNDWISDEIKDVEDKVGVALASYSQDGFNAESDTKVPKPGKKAPADKECSWVKPSTC